MTSLVGAKESATLNKIITVMNITCISFIIILGSFYINTANWDPVLPQDNAEYNTYTLPSTCEGSGRGFVPCGFNGILKGAVKVFFSYIGFDSVTTLAEEVRNPRKDIPFGVVLTLAVGTALYVGAALVIVGMVPWYALDQNTPVASAFAKVGLSWASTLIAALTVTALTVTTLCSLFGQPRIFFRMAKDGLLNPSFSKLTAGQVPLWGTVVSGVTAGLIAFTLDIGVLSEMISMGTLMAFSTVNYGYYYYYTITTTLLLLLSLLLVLLL